MGHAQFNTSLQYEPHSDVYSVSSCHHCTLIDSLTIRASKTYHSQKNQPSQRPRVSLVQTTTEENIILSPDRDVLMKALTIYGHIDAASMRSGIPSRAARGIFTLCWRILVVSQRIGGIGGIGGIGVITIVNIRKLDWKVIRARVITRWEVIALQRFARKPEITRVWK